MSVVGVVVTVVEFNIGGPLCDCLTVNEGCIRNIGGSLGFSWSCVLSIWKLGEGEGGAYRRIITYVAAKTTRTDCALPFYWTTLRRLTSQPSHQLCASGIDMMVHEVTVVCGLHVIRRKLWT